MIVAHAEVLAAQDHEVARDRRDDPLQGEGEPRRDQARRRGEAGRIVEPDREQADQDQDRRRQIDPLAHPELGLLIAAPAHEVAHQDRDHPTKQEYHHQKRDREEQFLPVLRIEADESDPE